MHAPTSFFANYLFTLRSYQNCFSDVYLQRVFAIVTAFVPVSVVCLQALLFH